MPIDDDDIEAFRNLKPQKIVVDQETWDWLQSWLADDDDEDDTSILD